MIKKLTELKALGGKESHLLREYKLKFPTSKNPKYWKGFWESRQKIASTFVPCHPYPTNVIKVNHSLREK